MHLGRLFIEERTNTSVSSKEDVLSLIEGGLPVTDCDYYLFNGFFFLRDRACVLELGGGEV